MKTKAKLNLRELGTKLVNALNAGSDSEEKALRKERDKIVARLSDIDTVWKTKHLSLADAVHLQKEEQDLILRRMRIDAKLPK